MIIVVLVATLGLAQRSLYTHVRDVLRPLARGDLAAARDAVSKIVGRDTAQLTPQGVAAAAIESLAESFNDGDRRAGVLARWSADCPDCSRTRR